MIMTKQHQGFAAHLLSLVFVNLSPVAPPPVKVVSSPAHEAALKRAEDAVKARVSAEEEAERAERAHEVCAGELEATDPENLPALRDRELVARAKLTKARKAASEALTRQHEAQLDALAAAHDRADTLTKIRGLGSEFLNLMTEARAAESRAIGLALEADRLAGEYRDASQASEGRLPPLEWVEASFALVVAGLIVSMEETSKEQATKMLDLLEGPLSPFGSIFGTAREEVIGMTAREYLVTWAETMDRAFASRLAKERHARKAAESAAMEARKEEAREAERARQNAEVARYGKGPAYLDEAAIAAKNEAERAAYRAKAEGSSLG